MIIIYAMCSITGYIYSKYFLSSILKLHKCKFAARPHKEGDMLQQLSSI